MLRRLPLSIGLLMILIASTASAAENHFTLTSFIVTQVRESLPATAGPFDRSHESRINMVTGMFDFGYYPPNYELMRAAVVDALASADKSKATADSLTFMALMAAARAYGHDTLLIDKSAPETIVPTTLAPSARTDGDIRIVVLPDLNLGNFESAGKCSAVPALADLSGEPQVRALILDLRGNEGGLLMNVACVAGLFVKKNTPLFTIDMKDLGPEQFEASIADGNVNRLPMAVLIDRRTDSGGLLLAAVLQRTGRAKLVGETRKSTEINGDVHSLFFVRNTPWNFKIPTGRILLATDRPLADGVAVDVLVSTADEAGLMNAARALFKFP